MPRFDTDTLSTNATRAYATRRPELEEGIRGLENDAREAASALTLQVIKRLVEEGPGGCGGKPTTKAEWIEVFAKQNGSNSSYAEELNKLNVEALVDGRLARHLNGLLEDADKAEEALREIVNNNSGEALYRMLAWKADTCIEAQGAATHAVEVYKAVHEGGLDLRDAVMAVLKDVMHIIIEGPNRLYNSSGSQRHEVELNLRAANRFRDQTLGVMWSLEQVPANLVRR